eukprot:scaffold237889_cov13-Tisochrysis_lutea.AAC.1
MLRSIHIMDLDFSRGWDAQHAFSRVLHQASALLAPVCVTVNEVSAMDNLQSFFPVICTHADMAHGIRSFGLVGVRIEAGDLPRLAEYCPLLTAYKRPLVRTTDCLVTHSSLHVELCLIDLQRGFSLRSKWIYLITLSGLHMDFVNIDLDLRPLYEAIESFCFLQHLYLSMEPFESFIPALSVRLLAFLVAAVSHRPEAPALHVELLFILDPDGDPAWATQEEIPGLLVHVRESWATMRERLESISKTRTILTARSGAVSVPLIPIYLFPSGEATSRNWGLKSKVPRDSSALGSRVKVRGSCYWEVLNIYGHSKFHGSPQQPHERHGKRNT